jgi:hypothetical protein
MGKTNWKHVFLGGLMAWIVLEILFVVALATYLKDLWDPAILAVNPDFEDTPGLQIFYVVFHLIAAILAVWLYSAIRPRLGAGPKTALIAGLFVWFFYGLSFGLNAGAMGLIPTKVLVADSLTTLVQYVVATLAGAWIYKEEQVAQ